MFKRKKKSAVEKAREDIEKQIRVVNKQARDTRKDLVKRMNQTADDLRSGLDHVFSREEQKEANKIAGDLEAIARDVEKRAEDGLAEMTSGARENVWGTVLVTLIAGVVLGIILRNLLD